MLAKQPGFPLHAATCREANQRDKFQELCRYVARPAIANDRLSINERRQVIYKRKQPFQDGATQMVLDPVDCIARLGPCPLHPTCCQVNRRRLLYDATFVRGLKSRFSRRSN